MLSFILLRNCGNRGLESSLSCSKVYSLGKWRHIFLFCEEITSPTCFFLFNFSKRIRESFPVSSSHTVWSLTNTLMDKKQFLLDISMSVLFITYLRRFLPSSVLTVEHSFLVFSLNLLLVIILITPSYLPHCGCVSNNLSLANWPLFIVLPTRLKLML